MAIGLVAFDLDGTLVRGETCVQAIARAVGRTEECAAFEHLGPRNRVGVTAAREQMARWYSDYERRALCEQLSRLSMAPGATEAFDLLRKSGVKTAIVSITWRFAVDWFADRLGADFSVGTDLAADGSVTHFWPEDKGPWLVQLRERLGLAREQVAAVGDSDGDRELLAAAGQRYFVGETPPPVTGAIHMPRGDLATIAAAIIA